VRLLADLPPWSDSEFVELQGREVLADDFVHDDRRPLIATPRVDRDTYVAQLVEIFDVYSFEQVVAVWSRSEARGSACSSET
jgi:hypothetical protein